MTTLDDNKAIIEASGSYVKRDRMVSFLYELMRDHLTPGKVEEIVRHVLAEDSDVYYCNGWLAKYAAYIVDRLTEKKP